MGLRRHLLPAAVIAGLLAAGAAKAQDDKPPPPIDLKPLVPPVFVLPPQSNLNPGTVGGAQTPYTTAPLQDPAKSPQPTPGIRFSIPR
jgi:hypothetical protein